MRGEILREFAPPGVSTAVAVLAERTSSCGRARSRGARRAGASSSTTCALVPPTPKSLRPRAGAAAPRGHGAARDAPEGRLIEMQRGIGRLAIDGGRDLLVREARAALMRLADARGGIEWPMLPFTEPRAQKPRRSVPQRKTWASARPRWGRRAASRCRAPRCRRWSPGDAGDGLRERDDLGLALDAGRGEAHLFRAVVIERVPDDGVDLVALGEGVLEAFSTTTPAPLEKMVPFARSSKGRHQPSPEVMPPSW